MKKLVKIIAVLWMFVAAPLFAAEDFKVSITNSTNARPLPYYRLTVAWSNAALTAMLAHFSDCAKELNLPVPTPITTNQVAHFAPPIETGAFQAAVWLTNGYWLDDFNGALSFRSRDDLFTLGDMDRLEGFVGSENMTTKEAIDLVRKSFVKLGYKLSDFGMDGAPDKIDGPSDWKNIGHMPFCELTWCRPTEGTGHVYYLRFDVDMNKKRLAGMTLLGKKLWRPAPKIDAVPEFTNRPPPPSYFH